MDEHGNVTDDSGTSIYNLQIYSQKGGIAFPRNARTYASYDLAKVYGWHSMSRLMKWPRSLVGLR